MFGFAENPGILQRSISFLLEKKTLSVSVVEITGSNFFDLVNGKEEKSEMGKQTKLKLQSINEFEHLISTTLTLRKKKSTNENQTSSRSHLFFNFQDENGASLAFVDLAGWESLDNKDDIQETRFINSTLSRLNTVFQQISQQQVPSFDTNLSKMFKPFLTKSGKCCMLYHVSNIGIKKGLENIKNVVASNKGVKHHKPALKDVTNINH